MPTRIKVLGARVTDPGMLRRHVKFRQNVELLMRAFQQELRELVTTSIYDLIASGKWHTSRNPNYAVDRANRMRRRTGIRAVRADPETRARRRKGATRIISEGADPDEILRDPVLRSQFEFIAKRVAGKTPKTGASRARAEARTKFGASGDKPSSETVEAFKAGSKLVKRYRDLSAKDPRAAREYIKARSASFHDYVSRYTEWTQNTKAGRRLMRTAARNYQRSERQLFDSLEQAQETLGRRATLLKSLEGSRKRVGARRSRKPGRLAQAHGNFGFVTGSFASAWAAASLQSDKAANDGSGFKFTWRLKPGQQKNPMLDNDGRPPADVLTLYLQRIIRRQGGNPDLLRRSEFPKIVRRSLRQAISQAQRWGLRAHMRGPK